MMSLNQNRIEMMIKEDSSVRIISEIVRRMAVANIVIVIMIALSVVIELSVVILTALNVILSATNKLSSNCVQTKEK